MIACRNPQDLRLRYGHPYLASEVPCAFLERCRFPIYRRLCVPPPWNLAQQDADLKVDNASRLCSTTLGLTCCLPCPLTDWVYPDGKVLIGVGSCWLTTPRFQHPFCRRAVDISL